MVIGEAGSVAEALVRPRRSDRTPCSSTSACPTATGSPWRRAPDPVPGRCAVVLFSSDGTGRTRRPPERAGAVGFVPKDELSGPTLRRLSRRDRVGADWRPARPLRVTLGEDDVLLREGIARILVGAGLDVVAPVRRRRRPAAPRARPSARTSSSPTCRCHRAGRTTACRPRSSCAAAGPGPACSSCPSSASPPTSLELVGERPRAWATCSRKGSATSPRSSTRSAGSPPAAARSTPRWSPACSAATAGRPAAALTDRGAGSARGDGRGQVEPGHRRRACSSARPPWRSTSQRSSANSASPPRTPSTAASRPS